MSSGKAGLSPRSKGVGRMAQAHAERAERREQAVVEGGDREPVMEREVGRAPLAGAHDQPVGDEVELDLGRSRPRRASARS